MTTFSGEHGAALSCKRSIVEVQNRSVLKPAPCPGVFKGLQVS